MIIVDSDDAVLVAQKDLAEDVKTVDSKYKVICEPDVFGSVQEALQKAEIETEVSELNRIPNDTVDLDVETAKKVLKLMDKLDDHDDVQKVASNFNIPDEAMAQLEAEQA